LSSGGFLVSFKGEFTHKASAFTFSYLSVSLNPGENEVWTQQLPCEKDSCECVAACRGMLVVGDLARWKANYCTCDHAPSHWCTETTKSCTTKPITTSYI